MADSTTVDLLLLTPPPAIDCNVGTVGRVKDVLMATHLKKQNMFLLGKLNSFF